MAAKKVTATSPGTGAPAKARESTGPEMVDIYIMGKRYEVPKGLTIQKALEYAGMTLLRGCGCRGGFCGACGTVYRTKGDYKLKVALACQTVVEDGMYLTQIPFYPAHKALYDVEGLEPELDDVIQCYPELMRCVQCGTCTKVCPQDIDVMQYMATAMRGDIVRTADLSFDCIMCGLCASRCPAETVQYYVGILNRRLYGKYLAPKAEHVAERIKELEAKKFDNEIDNYMKMDEKELQKLYETRDIEPEDLSTEPAMAVSGELND